MLKYLSEQFLYEDNAKISSIKDNEDGEFSLVLNSTIFYPKGGGQPSDSGIISSEGIKFLVRDVRFMEGVVFHIGSYEGEGRFQEGMDVNLKVDEAKRWEHSAIHTLGHLIDEAMLTLGYYEYITPSKGFHYPEGPNVEYIGDLSKFNLEDIKKDVEDEVNRMLREGFEVKAFFIKPEDVYEYCHKITVDPAMLVGKDLRVVVVWGDKGITCGGMHVKNINEIKGITVTKLVNKKNNVKVSYRLVA